jgi:hypothetical protein
MELDDLKRTWVEHDRALETSVRLNQKLLSALYLDRARSALQRQTATLAIEAVLTLIVVAVLGVFVHAHFHDPRFLVPGIMLDVFAVAILADLIRQFVTVGRIDYTQRVGFIQRQIEELRVMRIRHVRWVFLFATLVWTPLLIVVLEALARVNAYDVFPVTWLLANVALGVAVIPLGLWLSRHFSERMKRFPLVQQLMRTIAGRDLQSAERYLATLADFEHAER